MFLAEHNPLCLQGWKDLLLVRGKWELSRINMAIIGIPQQFCDLPQGKQVGYPAANRCRLLWRDGVNISFQGIDEADSVVHFYAPVFSGIRYKTRCRLKIMRRTLMRMCVMGWVRIQTGLCSRATAFSTICSRTLKTKRQAFYVAGYIWRNSLPALNQTLV